MIRFAPVLALAAATPVLDEPVGGYYVAVPSAQPVKTQVMTRSAPWSLQNGAYVAQRAPEREMVVCQQVARGIGALQSFTAGGRTLDADALATCNAHAK